MILRVSSTLRLLRQNVVLGALFLDTLFACSSGNTEHKHSDDHPSGHDHHQPGHGHGEAVVRTQTLWNEEFELFVEHNPGVIGSESTFLFHVTKLDEFEPVTTSVLSLELEGPAELRGHGVDMVRPGIFEIKVTPAVAGTYKGKLRISPKGERADTRDRLIMDGIDFVAYGKHAPKKGATAEDEDSGVIEFLKEQQWGVEFRTAFAATSSLAVSVEVAGRVDVPSSGRAMVVAPVSGRLSAPSGGIVTPGATVVAGQVVARLFPTLSSPEDAARASLVVTEAEARAVAARQQLARVKRLFEADAISLRDVENARREKRVSEEALRSARRAAKLYTGGRAGQVTWPVDVPIGGVIESVSATPGAMVSSGDTLFEVVNTDQLWIVALVPEQDASQLRMEGDARYQVAGSETWHRMDVTGEDANAAVVTVGRTVDPLTRAVEVLYSLREPGSKLRVGGMVQVSLPIGKTFEGVVIPTTALVNRAGRDVVYVQVDGEHFEERLVRLGPRTAGLVAVADGLLDGERIVTVGAHLVRLAERSMEGASAHGHVH